MRPTVQSGGVGMRFGLLGPLTVYDDEGTAHPVGGPKARALLTALLLGANRVVSVDALKDALWGADPPASAHASLHNHVTRLRRALTPLTGEDVLRAVAPGYLLRVAEGELDTEVFQNRIAAARAAHAGRDWATTSVEAGAALALWRGAPEPSVPGMDTLLQRLEEARLLALEWRYDAELAMGDRMNAWSVPGYTGTRELGAGASGRVVLAVHED
ncbi:BTAD domain-containing putative transcriptional regulator, partial [Streptomyces sp. GC420]|uniref:AfsR/SARP family transcriptional regulator n=1 Tax=Streptomyces sp. GC420 TaxID=2697568 RepID=UPI001AA1CA13